MRSTSHLLCAGVLMATAFTAATAAPRRARVVQNKAAASAPAPTTAGQGAAAKTGASPGRLVLASYAYGYQGDSRKPFPQRGVRVGNGGSALAHHPWESTGPWFSYARPQWHKNQLAVMHGAGVDVALLHYSGSGADRRAYATAGLDTLAAALKEMRSAPSGPGSLLEYPQVAPSIDLQGLAQQYEGPVDLRQPDVQRSLYGMIRESVMRVPEPFRASVQLPDVKGGAPAAGSSPANTGYLLRLVGARHVKTWDAGFIDFCNRRFAAEFGARLVWIGTPDMRGPLPGLHAYSSDTAASNPTRVETGMLAASASLGPGFENSLFGGDGSSRSRANGSSYITDWRAAIEVMPRWIFLDSWNDFSRGTELAPTMEYGLQFRDLTRGASMQFKEGPDGAPYAGTVIKTTAPRTLHGGVISQVEALVKNEGSVNWDPLSRISLSYRWYRDGKQVGDPAAAAIMIQPRGAIRSYQIGVTGPMSAGKPLAAGVYQLRFGMLRRGPSGEQWLEDDQCPIYQTTVSVGDTPALRPYWLESTMVSAGRAGASYRVNLKVRNDGSEPWNIDNAAVAFRWRRVGTYLKGYAEDVDERVVEGPKVPLTETVEPGRTASMSITVPFTDAQNKPLPVWTPEMPWSYVLEWDLWDGRQWASAAGTLPFREVVEVVERDPAAGFLGCSLPAELVAGRTEKVTLGLRNLGPDTWKAGRDSIAVHWYYLDGSEAAWMDTTIPLTEDVPPYSEAVVETGRQPKKGRDSPMTGAPPAGGAVVTRDVILRDLQIRVPDYFGPMYCVFDLVFDGQPGSTAAASHGDDILVVPVNVYSPSYLPLPLSAFFNVDGISSDLNRADGNLDGRGSTLPAEQLPPYVARPAVGSGPSSSPIYPCGLWTRALSAGRGDRVTFMYPGKVDKAPNMVACEGQRLVVTAGPRAAVHLLALGASADAGGEFKLIYDDSSVDTRPVRFTHFTEAPKNGEHAAFVLAHRHTAAGDDLTSRCYLNHYTLAANPRKSLIAIELPRNPGMKIMAVTLESGTSPGSVSSARPATP